MKNNGSGDSFEEIIDANKASIYRICRIYAVAPIEPADLFQEVVYHVWKSYDSYYGDAQVGTWIYRIALNVCLRYKLKLEKHNSKTERLSAITILPEKQNRNNNQEEKFMALRSCIQELVEVDRSIIILHLEGFSYREIFEVTGLSENHVAVKMKRIRKKLFDCITPKLN